VLFVFISTTLLSTAQQIVSVDETIFIHANSTTFVSGETLLYKIYCLKSSDNTLSSISKVAYVELIDNTKNTIFKNKITLNTATGQGDYFIPTTLKTGNYKLIAYTNWMLNKPPSTYFQIDITIINPYKKQEKSVTDTAENKNIFTPKYKNAIIGNNILQTNIKMQLNKKAFKNREFVDLKIESMNKDFQEGSYSLSVRKIEDLPSTKQITAMEFSTVKNESLLNLQNPKNKIQIPELRGEIISGKITAKNDTDKIENKLIAFSLPGKNFIFKIVRTDVLGNFKFNINKENYSSEITIQLIEDDSNNYNIFLNEDVKPDYSNLSIATNYNLPSSIKENLINRSINSQIENAYYSKKTDEITKSETTSPFYYPIAKQYILDKYTRFNTLKETITEVTTELYTKQEGNKLYLHVNDPHVFPQLPDPALVLIDGLYLENQKELFDYKIKNVATIEIIPGKYYLGSVFFNGLVSFTTFDNNYKSSQSGSSILKTTILRPQPKKKYKRVDHSNLTKNDRIPDFRNQLLWNPEVELSNLQSMNSFYTSDDSGIFEIRLEGFSKKGIPVSLQEIIEVKE
jgi:hypothetical protein